MCTDFAMDDEMVIERTERMCQVIGVSTLAGVLQQAFCASAGTTRLQSQA
jgi:hypothetical protein